jgi:hypothetical protein
MEHLVHNCAHLVFFDTFQFGIELQVFSGSQQIEQGVELWAVSDQASHSELLFQNVMSSKTSTSLSWEKISREDLQGCGSEMENQK